MRRLLPGVFGLALLCCGVAVAQEKAPIVLGLHADMSSGSALAVAALEQAGVELRVVQTFSFVGNRSARAREVAAKYHARFGTRSEEELFSAVGTAQAHDAVWLRARAIQKAKSTERARVRDALERLGPYEGLVRTYHPAFTPSHHEALSASDYGMATFNPRGVLVPAQP